jgi:predicted naringenin-chalcone synthase
MAIARKELPVTAERLPAPARILAVATATPPTAYTQEDVLKLFQVEDPRIRSLFLSSAIERRFLTLPVVDGNGQPRMESQGDLLRKHQTCAVEIGTRAVESALRAAGYGIEDVRHLCCVTSTGFLTPGLSALLCKSLNANRDCVRLDIVGMGCNAGLNALSAVAGWTQANPGELAALLCVEVCSAAYVFDGSMQTAVVNSLFGDGAAAAVVMAPEEPRAGIPALQKFSSCIVPEAVDAMRFSWDESHSKFSFFLDRDVPYMVGAHSEQVIGQLLHGTGLRRNDIAHWIIHAGGKKVIDAVKVNLGLTEYDMRHTSGVLRDYGNLSSGSFLFSYERLQAEQRVEPGDYGVMMTMGPGLTIEMALVRW